MIIATPRLYLREFTPDDDRAFFELNNDPEVLKYTGDEPFASINDARDFLTNYREYAINGYGRWAVIRKDSGQFIGWCGLKKHNEGYTDLGFRFFRNQWGQGFATESARATIQYGFNALNLDEIIGRVASENKASMRVLEKLNMKYWKKDACDGIPNAIFFRIRRKSTVDRDHDPDVIQTESHQENNSGPA